MPEEKTLVLSAVTLPAKFAQRLIEIRHLPIDRVSKYVIYFTIILKKKGNYSGSGATHLVNRFFLQIAAQHSQNLYL